MPATGSSTPARARTSASRGASRSPRATPIRARRRRRRSRSTPSRPPTTSHHRLHPWLRDRRSAGPQPAASQPDHHERRAMLILGTSTQLLRRILDALLVMLIVVVLVAVALGRLVPMLGHETFIIGGGSMEPAVPR